MKRRRDGKEDMHLFYPNVCVACRQVLSYENRNKGVCSKCRQRLPFVGKNICGVCGKELSVPFSNRCKDCGSTKHEFDEGRSVFLYHSSMKNIMYRFKYSNARYMARFFAMIAKEKYGDWMRKKGVEAIVPVPMFAWKKRIRGYNQAEVFGKALADCMGIPCLPDLVIRKKNTVPQKCLSRKKRKENLKNAFKIQGYDVKLNCVLIVDDIYTTGTTMDAMAQLLKENGIERVLCLTICIGADT